jgi:hypothetical protein
VWRPARTGFPAAASSSRTERIVRGIGPVCAHPAAESIARMLAAIDAKDVIVGWFSSRNAQHGFERSASGTFASIDPGGAVATMATGINTKLTIAGAFEDEAQMWHGFVFGK